MDRWPYIFFLILLAVPLSNYAFTTDTFSTSGFVNIEDVRGDGYAYTESIFDAHALHLIWLDWSAFINLS